MTIIVRFSSKVGTGSEKIISVMGSVKRYRLSSGDQRRLW